MLMSTWTLYPTHLLTLNDAHAYVSAIGSVGATGPWSQPDQLTAGFRRPGQSVGWIVGQFTVHLAG